MKRYIFLISLAALLAACAEKTPEESAANMLREARYALHHHLWNEARDTIFSLRRNCPTAIEARRHRQPQTRDWKGMGATQRQETILRA